MAVVHEILSRKKLDTEIRKFQAFLLVERGLRPKTRELYSRIVIMVLRRIGSIKPTKLQASRYVMSLYERQCSGTHIRNQQLAIENYMRFTGQRIEFKRPKKKDRLVRDCLSEAEVAVLINAASNIREKAILSVLACTGIRNQELCNLRVEDLDIPHNLVRIMDGKGGYSTTRNLPPDCIEIVMKYTSLYSRRPDEFLFTTLRKGAQYTTWALRRLVKKAARKAKIEKRVHPHRLRHSLATNLLNRGANIHSVQWQLGHRHLVTTTIYLHSNPTLAHREVANFQPAYL